MSTNIQIDVLLQRLKQVSDQTAQQNRSEKQDREDALLLEQQQGDTAQQGQTVFDLNPRQPLSAIEQLKAQSAAERSSVPDLYKKKRPAAQRLTTGSTMGVEYTTELISGFPSSTLRLIVGPPGQQQKVQVDLLEPSSAGATNLPASTDSSSGSESVVGFLTTSAPDFFGFTWRTQYPCGFTFQTGKGTAPTTSWTEFTTPRVDVQNYDDSQKYLLPIGDKSCIFIYLYSKLKVLTVFERFGRTDRVSVNARETSSGCGLQPGTYYDRQSTFQEIDTVDNIEQRQRYQVLAFYVNENSVRQLEVPQSLEDAIRALHPPMVVNDTAEQATSSSFTRFEFADVAFSSDEPQNYDGPVTLGYSQVPFVNISKIRQASLHGNYEEVNARNAVLARQFGIGFINEESHDGEFFSPAVFRFITAAMDLKVASARNYAYMRSTYFSKAPRRYLAPCVFESSCSTQQSVGFDETSTAPVDIDTAVPSSAFKRQKRYDIALNGAYDYEVVYGWDWDNSSFCKQQLKGLGFTDADLKP